MKDPRQVLQLHLMTEKSSIMHENNNSYVFRVHRNANKVEIKSAVEKAFGVKVDSVRTMTVPGKPKRLGRFEGKTSAWKKAIVKLRKDQHITDFDNI
jgi:large subunit ribosomal protein L23